MPTSIFNVKFAILWCDCLIYEIMHAAPKYGNNTKGGEEKLNCNLKFHNEGILYKGSALFHNFSCIFNKEVWNDFIM